MKPPKSILDPSFRWTPPANTDVGKYLREHLRRQRAAQVERAAKVTTLVKCARGKD